MLEWCRLNLKQITHVVRGFIYKCVQVDVLLGAQLNLFPGLK